MLDDLASSCDALTVMLRLVAGSYKAPPGEELVEYLKRMDMEDREDLFLRDEECRAGISLMRHFCRKLEMEEAVRRATADQNRLFVGPLHLPSSPWSSVYMDRGLLFGPTALAVEAEFKRLGFWIPEGNHEPCDHIAYELQFVGELNKKAVEKFGQGNEAGGCESLSRAKQFIDEYVSPWLGEFLERVEKHAETDFYRGLAKLTSGVVRLESEFLDAVTPREANGVPEAKQ